MMCEECGVNEASVHVTALVNGEKKEQWLCTECVAKKQLLRFDLSAVLGQLAQKAVAEVQKPPLPENDEPLPDLTCPECGMTYAQFHEKGRLGCAGCYDAFREPLTERLARTCGSARHVGMLPRGVREEVSLRMKLDKLKQQMAQAVETEEYETAARLRDEIRGLAARLEGAE